MLDATGVEVPMPLSMLNAPAFVVVHARVDEEPLFTEAGDAVSVQAGTGGGAISSFVIVQTLFWPAVIVIEPKALQSPLNEDAYPG